MSVVAKTAGWTKMPLGMEAGLGPGDFVFDGTQLCQKGTPTPTQFLAHVYCGQTAEWIKMPLGTEVNLSPGGFVLDGDPIPSPKRRYMGSQLPLKGAQPPSFWFMSIMAKRLDG